MFNMLSAMFCFVTATVSFLYGTRICWVCGKKCNFDLAPAEKIKTLKANFPGAFIIYSFGFVIAFNTILDGAFTILITSLISALLLSHFVISMAMPAFKRDPSNHAD